MDLGFFILTALLIALISGAIYALKWLLDNVQFSEDPKTQKVAEIIVKVAIVIFGAVLAYVIFEALIILISPLFDQLNAAFAVAASKIFAFLDQLIPWAVLGGIGYGLWKKRKPKKHDDKEPIPPEVAVALARQRGMELQKFMLRFLLRIIEATRSITLAVPPRDEKDLAISSLDNPSFYMVGEVVIFQGIVQINAEITPEMEDAVRDELQNAVPKHIDEYPALVDPTAANTGYPPVEILTVQKSGSRVIIDAVIASEKSISLIKNSRQARVERQKRQEREGDAGDPLFR